MKKIALLSIAFLSLSAFSSTLSEQDKASAQKFITNLEVTKADLLTAAQDSLDRLDKFNELSTIHVIKRNQIRQEHCGFVNMTLGAVMTNIVTSLESSKEALKKIEVTDEEALALRTNLKMLTAKSREAIEGCKDIKESIDSMIAAHIAADNALFVLEKVIK